MSFNWKELIQHDLICTGTTGKLVEETLIEKCVENNVVPPTVTKLKSGPLGGDQQLGAMIAEERLDALVFFIDPLSPHPHDVDVKALLRIATLGNIPFACNEATADLLIAGKG